MKTVSLVVAAVVLAIFPDSARPEPGIAKAEITRGRAAQTRYAGDPLAVRAMNPTFDTFPDASLVDFSFLLDAPAGKHGFVVRADDGTFRYEKTGKRAKFWGVTVAADHAGSIEKQRIELVTDVLARGGCNLLRLHELDNRGGEQYNLVRRSIIDEAYPNNNKSTEFDLEYRDRVDWWVACAQKRGMYVYLVIRAYRTFRDGDGLENADKLGRAAKPYAFFDPRLIELQKQYADEWLFKHVNPYTGIPNGINPAVCMLEIENEDSLFFGHVAWREFAEPYRTNFRKMWNDWLKKEHGGAEGLRKAWTNAKGECALASGESPDDGSVGLPGMDTVSLEKAAEIPWADPVNSPARNRDGVRFAAEVQRHYFATMRDFLRERGAKMPFSAVVHSGVLADTFTCAQELDSSAENAYLDHPSFLPGAEWVGKQFFSNRNYVADQDGDGLATHMARYRWADTPLVCREWTQCWPNDYRCASFPNMAAHAAVQDFDMIIHFAYYTWGDQDIVSAFGPQSDPARWGLNGYAAAMFLRGDIPAEQKKIALAFNNEDLATWGAYTRPFHQLAWSNRLENWNPDWQGGGGAARKSGDVMLTITSGRSGTGSYMGDNLLLFDPRYAGRSGAGAAERSNGLIIRSGYDHPWIYQPGDFPVAEVKEAGYRPVLPAPSGPTCKGFHDPKRNVIVLGDVTETSATAIARQFAAAIATGRADFEIAAATPDVFSSLDGAILRDSARGVLRIATERSCAVAGGMKPAEAVKAGVLELITTSPIASVIACSLDGKPLADSRHIAVKMATVARNRGQQLDKVESGAGAGKYVLNYQGAAPVQAQGKPSAFPTTVRIAGRTLVEAYLVNGTWEAVFDLDKRACDLFCDTPNVRFVVDAAVFGDAAKNVPIRKFFTEHPPVDANQKGNDFVYPGFAKYVHLGK